jgi:hypothetical protein
MGVLIVKEALLFLKKEAKKLLPRRGLGAYRTRITVIVAS